MSDLAKRTAAELLADLSAGTVTSSDVCRAYLDEIERRDGTVGAFLRVDPAAAMEHAEAIDRRRRGGEPLGPLAGLPIAVKDLICDRGELTTCASRMLEHYRPPYDATIIERLRAADAVLLGRTNMDEFAMGGSTENSAFQVTTNPWDPSRVAGGSSGGAAACVAGRMAPLSIGTDTGGSIRCPAALCGVSGIKPTYGRVSRYGLVAFASSLDQIGPLAQSAEDCALLLGVLAGHDPRDSTSADRPVPDYCKEITRSPEVASKPLAGLRIGIVPEHFSEGLDADVEGAVREAIAVCESLGATAHEVGLPHGKYAVATYYIIAPSEASSNLARYDGAHYGHRADREAMLDRLAEEQRAAEASGDAAALDRLDTALVRMYRQSRTESFGDEVKRRIMLGTYALSAGYYDAYYLKALKVRRLIRCDYDEALGQVDLIAGPVTPTPAFRIGQRVQDPLAMYLFDLYTVSANLAGLPGMSIPCGFSHEGLPIGLHLQGRPFDETLLLRTAAAYQRETDWHRRTPD